MEIDGVVTDMAGRYGFHVPPGRYTIVPVKTHYSFPSKSLFGQSSDIVYDKLYFGESITVRDTETAIIRNIPMDAQGVDWNEEEKVRLGFVSTRKRRQYIRFVFNTVSLVGVAYSVYAWVQSPHVWNTLILVSYAGIFTVTLLYTRHFKLATVQMRGRGPLSFARIKLFFTEHDILAKQVVADADGKFYLLVPPGAYRLVVEARNNVGEYVQKLNVRELRLPRGIFTHDIIVPRSALSNVD
jgi:hypothetical protein